MYSKTVEPSSGANVIPRRARPGLAGLRPHSHIIHTLDFFSSFIALRAFLKRDQLNYLLSLRYGTRGVQPVSAAILCAGGLDVIRKEAWPFYRTSSGVRLCWELEEPKGPKGCLIQPCPAQGHSRRIPFD